MQSQNTVRKELADIQVTNEDERIFKAWMSVEVKDQDGDVVPMDELRKTMPILMKRSPALHDQHSNKPVGKILNYSFEEKETEEGKRPGVLLTCKIFNDYQHDNTVWQEIKDEERSGLSIGADVQEIQADETGDELRGLELYEVSVVDEPANQEATITSVNAVAKSIEGAEPNTTCSIKDENPCWDGYEMLGTKPNPDGEGQVPNCVPEDKAEKARELISKLTTHGIQRSTALKALFGDDTMTKDEATNQETPEQDKDNESHEVKEALDDIKSRLDELDQRTKENRELFQSMKEEEGEKMEDGDMVDEIMSKLESEDVGLEDEEQRMLEAALQAASQDADEEMGDEEDEDEDEADEEMSEEKIKQVVKQALEDDFDTVKTQRPANTDEHNNETPTEKDNETTDKALAIANGEEDFNHLEAEKANHGETEEALADYLNGGQ